MLVEVISIHMNYSTDKASQQSTWLQTSKLTSNRIHFINGLQSVPKHLNKTNVFNIQITASLKDLGTC